MLADGSFKVQSSPASSARKIADSICKWIPDHLDEAARFEAKLSTTLTYAFRAQRSHKARRERMWSSYHSLRTSDNYLEDWRTFLYDSISAEMSPLFCQYVGHYMFKQLIKLHNPLIDSTGCQAVHHSPLTYEETNALRYAAGYVPRALKKLLKSTHPLKDDLQLYDLLNDGDEDVNESGDILTCHLQSKSCCMT